VSRYDYTYECWISILAIDFMPTDSIYGIMPRMASRMSDVHVEELSVKVFRKSVLASGIL
jgi:hypothetical protein